MRDVLVIENDADTRSAITELLADEGYTAIGLSGSDEAIRYLSGHSAPCLVLLDIGARNDATAFLRWVQKQDQLRGLQVAVISGWQAPDRRLEGFRAHITRVIKKPFGIEDLTRAIAEHCGPAPGE